MALKDGALDKLSHNLITIVFDLNTHILALLIVFTVYMNLFDCSNKDIETFCVKKNMFTWRLESGILV